MPSPPETRTPRRIACANTTAASSNAPGHCRGPNNCAQPTQGWPASCRTGLPPMSASTTLQADISANRLGDGGDDTIHPECDRRSSSALPSGLQQRRHGVSIDVVEPNCTARLTFGTPVADRVPVGMLADADYPGETLLDSNNTERYPVAQNDIKFTSQLTWDGTPSAVPRRRMANAAGGDQRQLSGQPDRGRRSTARRESCCGATTFRMSPTQRCASSSARCSAPTTSATASLPSRPNVWHRQPAAKASYRSW